MTPDWRRLGREAENSMAWDLLAADAWENGPIRAVSQDTLREVAEGRIRLDYAASDSTVIVKATRT